MEKCLFNEKEQEKIANLTEQIFFLLDKHPYERSWNVLLGLLIHCSLILKISLSDLLDVIIEEYVNILNEGIEKK